MNKSSSASWFKTAILAVAATLGFYLAAPQIPGISAFVTRYFCSHPLEYICTAMFFTGLAVLAQKWLNILAEKQILRRLSGQVTDGLISETPPEAREEVLEKWCRRTSAGAEVISAVQSAHKYVEIHGQFRPNGIGRTSKIPC